MTDPTTHTLDVPGALLTYDVRSNSSSTAPVLLMIGSPMGAGGFGTLAGHFTDRTVITYCDCNHEMSSARVAQRLLADRQIEIERRILRVRRPGGRRSRCAVRPSYPIGRTRSAASPR